AAAIILTACQPSVIASLDVFRSFARRFDNVSLARAIDVVAARRKNSPHEIRLSRAELRTLDVFDFMGESTATRLYSPGNAVAAWRFDVDVGRLSAFLNVVDPGQIRTFGPTLSLDSAVPWLWPVTHERQIIR